MLDTLKAKWKNYVLWMVVAGIIIAANHWLNTSLPIPLPPQEFRIGDDAYNAGWNADPIAVKAVADTLQFATFADTPAGQVADPLPSFFYQFDIYRKCDPRGPPAKNQGSLGSCVSFGTNNAILRTMACQIVLNAANETLTDIAEEVTYGGSRVEIGKGRLGRGDGSVGAWAAQYVQKFGVVSRGPQINGKYDLSKYDINRCRQWGNTGVPADLQAVAHQHPVKDITLVKTWGEAKRALSQGYGIAVCSNQGFSMQRDQRGVARAQGSWGHCMCIDAYHIDGANGAEFAHIENSWGANAMTGPVGWGNPSGAGFWAESKVVERMIQAGDTWAFSGVVGFPARENSWFVNLQLQQPARKDSRLAKLFTKGFDPCVPFILAP